MTKIQFIIILGVKIGVKNNDFTEIPVPDDTILGPFENDCLQHCCILCIPEKGT